VNKPIRLTKATRAVLDILMVADPDNPPWGFRLCEEADVGSGSVYPMLERLEECGWIRGFPEEPQPAGRSARRYYEMTDMGRAEYSVALVLRAASRQRRRPGKKVL
jgi:PadR family transcriptional regulator, regulatory protein PadR